MKRPPLCICSWLVYAPAPAWRHRTKGRREWIILTIQEPDIFLGTLHVWFHVILTKISENAVFKQNHPLHLASRSSCVVGVVRRSRRVNGTSSLISYLSVPSPRRPGTCQLLPHCSLPYTCHSSVMAWGLPGLLCRWANWGCKRLCSRLTGTPLVYGRIRIWTQFLLTCRSAASHQSSLYLWVQTHMAPCWHRLIDPAAASCGCEMQPSLVLGGPLWDHWGKNGTEGELYQYSRVIQMECIPL